MNKLTKDLKCILMRNGVEIWAENDSILILLQKIAKEPSRQLLEYNGEFINTVDIIGIYKAKTIDKMKREKRGQWQCKYGNWHDKFKECDCKKILEQKTKQELEHQRIELSKNCDKCKDGYVLMMNKKGAEELLPCECIYSTISNKELKEVKDYIKENDFRII